MLREHRFSVDGWPNGKKKIALSNLSGLVWTGLKTHFPGAPLSVLGFSSPIFFLQYRLSLTPNNYPWVSENEFYLCKGMFSC